MHGSQEDWCRRSRLQIGALRGTWRSSKSICSFPDMTLQNLWTFLKDKKLAGEVSMSWCSTLDGQWVPLPSWMQLPIFRVASEWHNSLEKWMDRKDKNFKKTGKTKLRPSQEIEYEKFVSDSLDMKIYLNKKTHVQLLSSDSTALKHKRTMYCCCALECQRIQQS